MDALTIGVGTSSREDSGSAGSEAARKALELLKGKRPDVAIVFASPKFDHKQLLAGITSVVGVVPMVGGTTAGEISTEGLATDSVALMLLASEQMRFTVAGMRGMRRNEEECGAALARNLLEKGCLDDARSLIIFPDGMAGDGVALLRGIQSVLGMDIEIVGGFLGDSERFRETFQFLDGVCYRGDMVTALMIGGGRGFTTSFGVRSGFESIGNKFYCSAARKNVVMKFGDWKALDLYKEYLGEERSGKLPHVCLEYPFGLIDQRATIGDQEYFQLRCGLVVNDEEGSITLAGSIPEGSAVTITTASRAEIINGAKKAALQAVECLEGASPRVILMFSCIGRKIVLGRRTQEEIDVVRSVIGRHVPILGFYTYGEIGPIDKRKEELKAARFHNETVVLWVLGELAEGDQ